MRTLTQSARTVLVFLSGSLCGVVLGMAMVGVADESASETPDQDDVMRAMLESGQSVPGARPVEDDGEQAKPPMPLPDLSDLVRAPEQELGPLLKEGQLVISRRGRLVRLGDAKLPVFIFESEQTSHPERPVVIQCNTQLENLERLLAKHDEGVLIEITGHVQQYRGINYLLLSSARIVKIDVSL